MKIIMIGQKGIPAHSGGIEQHVDYLAQALAKRGHQIVVFTRPYYTPKTLKQYRGIRLISLPSLKTKNLDAASHVLLATLYAIFKEKDADIIHYHGIGPALFLWIPRLLKPRIRVVSTFHCQDYYHQKWSLLARFFLKLGELCSVFLSHQTIVVSRDLKQYIESRYHYSPTQIPNAVKDPLLPGPNIQLRVLREWNLAKEQYFLIVSRLVRHKGIHTAIKAYQKLPKKVQQDKKLVIVGKTAFTNKYAKYLKALAKDNPNIVFTGEQRGFRLQTLFHNAFLFIQPSESEGLSIALLEALSYGLPVLISNIPSNLEAAQGCGFVFPNKNAERLAEAIMKILSLPQETLKEKARLGRTLIRKKYNWKQVSLKTEEVYLRCTNYFFKPESRSGLNGKSFKPLKSRL